MPYIYPAVRSLANQPLVGTGTCVDLVKMLVPGLVGRPTSSWRAGANVMEARKARKPIMPGTAIATFENGRYPQRCAIGYYGSCHHAGLVVAVYDGGFWIMDQYTGDRDRLFVAMRFIRVPAPSLRRLPDGSYRDAGNNALAFHVIEQ